MFCSLNLIQSSSQKQLLYTAAFCSIRPPQEQLHPAGNAKTTLFKQRLKTHRQQTHHVQISFQVGPAWMLDREQISWELEFYGKVGFLCLLFIHILQKCVFVFLYNKCNHVIICLTCVFRLSWCESWAGWRVWQTLGRCFLAVIRQQSVAGTFHIHHSKWIHGKRFVYRT